MRKRLTLAVVDGHKLYGVDENDVVVLSPEDFRGTTTKSFALGTFKNGDAFDIDVDSEEKPIHRSFDNTVAIHKPIDKRYSKADVLFIVNKVKHFLTEGIPYDINDLLV
jgi:hypothetical protein